MLQDEVLDRSVEIGRACVAADHRNRNALFLLWKGLAEYAHASGARHLFGCCSLPTLDPATALRAYAWLGRNGHLHGELRVQPLPGRECVASPITGGATAEIEMPALFRAYLRHGAKVCGPPAVDREFGTIDFFTILDLADLGPKHRAMYFA
jgi:putative hemolysin